MEITLQFKHKVREAILEGKTRYGLTDAKYATKLGINSSIYSRLKNGELENIISNDKWLSLGREFNVWVKENNWKVARTRIYTEIEDSLKYCQTNSRSMMLVDEAGIGKTVCSRHIIKGLKNAFMIDCSQSKNKIAFIKNLARQVGVSDRGKYIEIKEDLKYALKVIDQPLIILDEAGDLDYRAFLEIKELWNATEGYVGWFMMGADGLRRTMQRGFSKEKVGYAEIFSRFSDHFIKLVPTLPQERQAYYAELVSDIAAANVPEGTNIQPIVRRMISNGSTLRALMDIIKLSA